MARKSGAAYTLKVLLTLNDKLSGRLNKSISALRRFDKQASDTLKTLNKLDRRAATAFGKMPATRGPKMPAAPTATGGRAYFDALRAQREQVKLLNEQARLRHSTARAAREEGRATGDEAQRRTRGLRESARHKYGEATARVRSLQSEVRLERERARLRNESARLSYSRSRETRAEELHGYRLTRERLRLEREHDTHGRRTRRGGWGGRMSGFERRMGGASDAVGSVGGIVGEVLNFGETMRPFWRAATNNIRAQARLKIIGLTQDEWNTAQKAIKDTGRAVRSESETSLIEQYTNLFQALGDAGQAARALPSAARYTTSFRAFFGDQFDPESANRQVLSSYKALEYMGATQRGEGEMDKLLQEFIRIQASTSGRVTPDEILVMLRRSKVAGRSLSAEGLRNISTLIEDFSAPTAGQSLMSAAQTIVGGVMKNSAMNEFMRLGLVDRSKVEYSKAGLPKKLLPEAIKGTDVFQRDPYEWVSKVLSPALQKSGINVEDDNAVRRQLFTMFGNRNAFAFIDTLLTQRLQVEKEARRMNVSADAYEQTRRLDIDPELKSLRPIEEVQAQWQNFQVAVGKNLLPAGTELVKVVTPLAQLVAQHPKLAAWTAGVIVGGKALGGLVETGMLLGRMGVGVYDYFDAVGGSARRASRDIGAADARARGFGRALRSVPKLLTVGVTLVGVELAIQKTFELKAASDDLRRANKGLDTTGDLEAKARAREREGYAARGEAYPQEKFTERARAAFQLLNVNRNLEYALDPARQSLSNRMFMYGENPFTTPQKSLTNEAYNKLIKQGKSPQEIQFAGGAQFIRSRAKDLEVPQVMAEFRKQINAMNFGQEAKAAFERMLQQAQPASYVKSSEILQNQFNQLIGPASLLPKSFQELIDPAQRLAGGMDNTTRAAERVPASLARVGSAADALASRLSSIVFQPPHVSMVTTLPGTTQQQPSINLAANKSFDARPFRVSGFDTGGTVERSGLALIHRAEKVVPARVARRWGDADDPLSQFAGLRERVKERGRPSEEGVSSRREELRRRVAEVSAAESATVSYSPSYSVSLGTAGDGEAALRELEARHARERAELRSLIMQRTSRQFVEGRLRHSLEVERQRGAGS